MPIPSTANVRVRKGVIIGFDSLGHRGPWLYSLYLGLKVPI